MKCRFGMLACMLMGGIQPNTGAFAALPATPAKEFRISGVVLSSRDESPVPYCRIFASTSGAANPPRIVQRAPDASDAQRFNRASPPPGMPMGRGVRGGPAANANPETKADGSGRFTLELPHGGSWRLAAAARGFRSQAYDEHEGYYSSIVLSDASPAYDVKFHMTPDSIISGLVIDEAGEPVATAQVIAELLPPLVAGQSRVSAAARPRQVANAQTDDRGRYELLGLAPGEYQVRVQAQPWYAMGARGGFRGGGLVGGGFGGPIQTPTPTSPDPSLDMVYATTWFPAADSEEAAETIALAGGEERQADFHLTAIAAVHLVVSRPEPTQPEPNDDRPRQQRPVTITRVTSDGSFGQTSFIGGNGRDWNFGGLSPGTYEVRLPGSNGDQDEVRQIEVRPGSSGLVTLEGSKPLAHVSIKVEGVSGEDVSDVEFFDTETGRRILSSSRQRGRRGRLGDGEEASDDPPGTMTAMLPAGRYEVNVAGGAGAYITSISAGGAKVAGRLVEIAAGIATLTLHMANTRAELAGIANLDGQPVSGALVLLVPATLGQAGDLTPLLRDQTNTDGSFTFHSVVPGRYILVAIDHGWRVDWRDPSTLAKYLSQGMPVELKGSGKLREEIAAVPR